MGCGFESHRQLHPPARAIDSWRSLGVPQYVVSQIISLLHIVQYMVETQDVDFILPYLVLRPLYIVSICNVNHNILWSKVK